MEGCIAAEIWLLSPPCDEPADDARESEQVVGGSMGLTDQLRLTIL